LHYRRVCIKLSGEVFGGKEGFGFDHAVIDSLSKQIKRIHESGAEIGLIVGGVCVSGPTLTSLVSRHAGSGERGAILGLSQSSAGLGRVLGPALSGTVFAGLGRDWPFYCGALVMVLMLALSVRLIRRGNAAPT